MTADEVARAVCDELDRRTSSGRRSGDGMTEAEHEAQHSFVKLLMEREKRRIDFWHDMHRHIAKVGAISIFTVLGAALYYYAKHLLAN